MKTVEYYSEGFVDEIIDECNKYLEIGEENDFILYTLGYAYITKGDYKNAMKYLQKAISIKDDINYRNSLAIAYKEYGMYEHAATEFQIVLSRNDKYADAHNNLGECYFEMDMLQEAEFEYNEALKINKDYILAKYNITKVYEKNGNLQKAYDILKSIIEDDLAIKKKNKELMMLSNNLILIYENRNMLDDAILHLKKVIQKYPNFADTRYHLGMALKKKGKYEEAMVQFRKAIELNKNYQSARKEYWECAKMVE